MKQVTNLGRRFIAFLAIAVLFGGMALKAEVVAPIPQNVTLSVVTDDLGQGLQISWTVDSSNYVPNYIIIYRASKLTTDTKEFKVFAKLGSGEMSYEHSQYIISNLEDGDYSFYLTSVVYNRDTKKYVESDPSTIQQITFKQTKYVKIYGDYSAKAYVGKEYTFEPKVLTNSDSKLVWTLLGNIPSDLKFNTETGKITWTPTASDTGSYTFILGVCLKNDTTITNAVTLKINVLATENHGDQKKYIMFASEPPCKLAIGDTFTYLPKITTNVNCVVNYSLVNGPDGMTIDTTTGLLTWLPTAAGEYAVAIKAYFTGCDSITIYALQKFEIRVDAPINLCGGIYGTITSGSTTITHAEVIAYSANHNTDYEKAAFETSVENGTYYLSLPSGTYYVVLEGKEFHPVYYDNTTDFRSAKTIVVSCDTTEINFTISEKVSTTKYTVTGTVIDASTNNPLSAMVTFLPLDTNGNINNNSDRYHAKTDKDGKYSISLPSNITFIARAIADEGNTKYKVQFYNLVESQINATQITLTADLADINFALNQVDAIANGFGGTVIADDSISTPIHAMVTAFLLKAKDTTLQITRYSYTVESDSTTGAFTFTNMTPGQYVLLSLPINRLYIPGYYLVSSDVTFKWKEATIITLDSTVLTDSYTIKHPIGVGRKGFGGFKGFVYNGSKGKGFMALETVPGALVVAVNESGVITDYGVTNSDGEYSLSQLPIGTFQVYVDAVVYNSYTTSTDVDYSTNLDNTLSSIYLTTSSVTSVNDLTTNNVNLIAYPQPTSDYTTIQFNGIAEVSNISVINEIGVPVLNYNINTVDGANLYTLNLTSLATGAYYLKIQSGSNLQVIQIRIVH